MWGAPSRLWPAERMGTPGFLELAGHSDLGRGALGTHRGESSHSTVSLIWGKGRENGKENKICAY